MKLIAVILFCLISYSSSYANDKICGWIMDEPFKEYQEEAKDQHAAFYVVVSDGECELEKREEGDIHQGWRESFRKNLI